MVVVGKFSEFCMKSDHEQTFRIIKKIKKRIILQRIFFPEIYGNEKQAEMEEDRQTRSTSLKDRHASNVLSLEDFAAAICATFTNHLETAPSKKQVGYY